MELLLQVTIQLRVLLTPPLNLALAITVKEFCKHVTLEAVLQKNF